MVVACLYEKVDEGNVRREKMLFSFMKMSAQRKKKENGATAVTGEENQGREREAAAVSSVQEHKKENGNNHIAGLFWGAGKYM